MNYQDPKLRERITPREFTKEEVDRFISKMGDMEILLIDDPKIIQNAQTPLAFCEDCNRIYSYSKESMTSRVYRAKVQEKEIPLCFYCHSYRLLKIKTLKTND